MTSSNGNFDEEFWFAVTTAKQLVNDSLTTSHQVVCLDCTQQKVRKHLVNLIDKINTGWLPPDNEFAEPIYDTDDSST